MAATREEVSMTIGNDEGQRPLLPARHSLTKRTRRVGRPLLTGGSSITASRASRRRTNDAMRRNDGSSPVMSSLGRTSYDHSSADSAATQPTDMTRKNHGGCAANIQDMPACCNLCEVGPSLYQLSNCRHTLCQYCLPHADRIIGMHHECPVCSKWDDSGIVHDDSTSNNLEELDQVTGVRQGEDKFTLMSSSSIRQQYSRIRRILQSSTVYYTADLVQCTLQCGADPDVTDADGMTFLHLAASYGDITLVQLLLRNGANPEIMNKFGSLPEDLTSDIQIKDILIRSKFTNSQRGIISTATPKEKGNEDIQKVIWYPHPALKGTETAKKMSEICNDVKFVNKFTKDVNVVVVQTDDDLLCDLSDAFLTAMLSKKLLVSSSWLDMCIEAETRIGEEQFEVRGIKGTSSCTAQQFTLLSRRQKPPLLFGYSIYFQTRCRHPAMTISHLVTMAKASEARVMSEAPGYSFVPPAFPPLYDPHRLDPHKPYHAPAEGVMAECTHLVLYDHEELRESLVEYESPVVKRLPFTWLCECVAHLSIRNP